MNSIASKKSLIATLFLALGLSLFLKIAEADSWRSADAKLRVPQQSMAQQITFSSGVTLIKDMPYGESSKQKMDIYIPAQAKGAPVIFMVHGGAWRAGDKANKNLVTNKVNRWVTKGVIFVSVNYRLVPEVNPLEQVEDIKRALSMVQIKASEWGGDPSKIVLMGHSAGAHLVSVLATLSSKFFGLEVEPWLGVVSIDSACFNVVDVMEAKHFRFYDKAFGEDINYWVSVSPFHLLNKVRPPFLAVCSTRRNDSCSQATQFIDKASAMGGGGEVLKINRSHADANEELGSNNIYTRNVEAFLASLDESLKRVL